MIAFILAGALLAVFFIIFYALSALGLSFQKKSLWAFVLSVMLIFIAFQTGSLKNILTLSFGTEQSFYRLQAAQLEKLLSEDPDNQDLALMYFSALSRGEKGKLTKEAYQHILAHWWKEKSPVYLNLLAVDAFQSEHYDLAIALWEGLKNESVNGRTPIDTALDRAKALQIKINHSSPVIQSIEIPMPDMKKEKGYTLMIAVKSVIQPDVPAGVYKMEHLSNEASLFTFPIQALRSMQGKPVTLKGVHVLHYQFLLPTQGIGDTPVSEGFFLIQSG